MKRLFLISLCCSLFLVAKSQVVSLNKVELVKLKRLIRTEDEVKKHWDGILKIADEALTVAPNPADTILTEGILQGDPRKTRTWESINDMEKVYALGLTYKISKDQQYLNKVSEFLLAWAKRNKPQGNPINDTNLDRIIFSYDLLKDELKADVNILVMKWLKEVADQEIQSYNRAAASKKQTHYNNWNSHRIKEVAEVAWAIGDKNLQNWALTAYKTQISKNLLPDGSSFDFHERDALHYHIYDVDPLMVAATIMTRSGKGTKNLYVYQSAEGSSLKKAIDWLIPFFNGEKTHAEWVNSKSAFDKKRAANGEKGYIAGTLFKPAEARSSIALANYFEPDLLTIYQAESKTTAKYPTWQFVLNEVKR